MAPGDLTPSGALADALATLLPPGPWAVERATTGSSGRVFTARSGERRVFLKCGVDVVPLRRLGELGVAPPVVASGSVRGVPFVAQRLVAAAPASPSWFDAEPAALARVLSRYRSDQLLASLAAPLTAAGLLRDLRARSVRLPQAEPELSSLLEALATGIGRVPPAPLVPSHGDPNASNLLVGEGGPWLVDWDGLRRSDPLRDLGQILWWYVPPDRWEAHLRRSGEAGDASAWDRVRWWAAAESVEVAVSLLESGAPDAAGSAEVDAAAFLRDAAAALEGRENPRAWFREEVR